MIIKLRVVEPGAEVRAGTVRVKELTLLGGTLFALLGDTLSTLLGNILLILLSDILPISFFGLLSLRE